MLEVSRTLNLSAQFKCTTCPLYCSGSHVVLWIICYAVNELTWLHNEQLERLRSSLPQVVVELEILEAVPKYHTPAWKILTPRTSLCKLNRTYQKWLSLAPGFLIIFDWNNRHRVALLGVENCYGQNKNSLRQVFVNNGVYWWDSWQMFSDVLAIDVALLLSKLENKIFFHII